MVYQITYSTSLQTLDGQCCKHPLLRSTWGDVPGFADKELLLDCTDCTFLLQPADSPAIVERSLANRIASGQALLTHR